jgi:hypothetical protein
MRNCGYKGGKYAFLLSLEILDSQESYPWQTFIAGFDPSEHALDSSKETELLVLDYGSESILESLRESVASMDFK